MKISKEDITDKVDGRSLYITTLENDLGLKTVSDIQDLKIYRVGIGDEEDIAIYGK